MSPWESDGSIGRRRTSGAAERTIRNLFTVPLGICLKQLPETRLNPSIRHSRAGANDEIENLFPTRSLDVIMQMKEEHPPVDRGSAPPAVSQMTRLPG